MKNDAVTLCPMTRALCHALFRDFQNDPDTFADMDRFAPFVYDEAWVERYFEKQQRPDRHTFAILRGGEVVGELLLKDIDRERRVCTLSIHLQSDAVKNRGVGTRAEGLALDYAFGEMGMEEVLADATLKNARSRHVLEKVGFCQTGEDETFAYYRCARRGGTDEPKRRDDA